MTDQVSTAPKATGWGLDARLLCICNVAAGIRQAGALSEDTYTFATAGFLERPLAMISNGGINAALIGRIPEGTVVCYRGTLAADDQTREPRDRFLDWVNDFASLLCPWLPGTGLCHSGFTAAVDSLELPELRPPVLFCGHSKGGAMSQLAALRYWLYNHRSVMCTTFGAPRCGGTSFAQAFDKAGVLLHRYENIADFVPAVPFEPRLALSIGRLIGLDLPAADYRSVGSLRWIDGEHRIHAPDTLYESMKVDAESVAGLLEKLTTGGFEAIREAHSIAIGSGYATALLQERYP